MSRPRPLVLLVLAACLPVLSAFTPGTALRSAAAAPARAMAPARATCVVAAARKKQPKKGSRPTNVDFAGTGSTDVDGYRRGSFGIGEKESVVIWGLVIAARDARHSNPSPKGLGRTGSSRLHPPVAPSAYAPITSRAQALVFGGALDDETAQRIGEAQRSFYPKPPGL